MGGKVLVRPLVQGMKAPVKAVDVDVHMDAMWGIAAHLVLEVGYKLVAGVLSAASLVTGSRTTAVGPDLIESGVHYERVKLAHGVFAKKGVSKTGVSKLRGELQSHGELVHLPASGAAAPDNLHRSVSLDAVPRVGINQFNGGCFLDIFAPWIDTLASLEEVIPI